MLFLAIVLNLARAVSPSLKAGAYAYYKFFSTGGDLSAAVRDRRGADAVGQAGRGVHPGRGRHHRRAVTTLMATGWFVGRRLGMYPIEAAIVTGCRRARAAPAMSRS